MLLLDLMFAGLLEKFLDLIYKKKCLICNCSKTDNLLCKTCEKDVDFLSNFPHKIYNSVPIYSATLYSSTVKKLIQLLKFQHRKKSSIVLGEILYKYYKKLDLKDNFIIIYPDSFFIKNMSRGYEHMFLIAQEFSKLSGLLVLKHAIQKIKPSVPQYKAKNRKNNVKNAFKVNKNYIKTLKEKPVLLIDDIITSGATIEEIINLLQKEGINNITVLTVSKAAKA